MEEITKTIKLYKGTVPIKFITDYADKHEYYNEKEERLKGVTYFTGVIDKSRPLIMWAVGLSRDFLFKLLDQGKTISIDHILEASKQHTKVKEEAADTGKQIHAWISRWINKEKKNDIPDDPKVRAGITAFMEYQSVHKIKWLESERIVYSKKYGYVGTADAIGKIGKDLILFDFKSSKPSTYSPDGIYPEHAIQTAGYLLAYEEEMKKKIAYRIIITLNKETGAFRFREFKDNKKDMEAFLCCLTLRRRIDQIK